MAAKKNLRYTRGDTMLNRTFRVYINKEPIVINEAHAHVRIQPTRESQLIFDLPCTPSGTSVVVGQDFVLEAEPDIYYWDMEIIYDTNKKLTILKGKFELVPDITYVDGP